MRYVVSALEMSELDRQTSEHVGVPARTLMEVAGRAVAQECLRRLRPGDTVTVAAGPGNNGGDGFVAARALLAAGHPVETFVFADRARIKGDAKLTLAALEKSAPSPITFVEDARALVAFGAAVKRSALVVDALLGVGATGEVRGSMAQAIDLLNDQKKTVVAVDIPSGVEADTGAVHGRAVDATVTVTFAYAKRGHYLFPGADRRGELVVADIGIPRRLADALGIIGRVLVPDDVPRLVPRRAGDAHKGTLGTLTVLAGSPGMPGAAMLALNAAIRAGVGLTRWAAEPATFAEARLTPPEALLLSRRGEDGPSWAQVVLQRSTALLIGPGWTTALERRDELAAILRAAAVPICLDADGLNLLAEYPELWGEVRSPLVITPHPKEMARLMRQRVEEIQQDRFARAHELAMARGCTVVLKGAGTLVAEPDGVVTVINAGNPGLATGGTGDVLAGIIGALLAQGLETGVAARAGTLVHAAAGDVAAARWGEAGLRAGDVVEALGAVWAKYGR